MAYAFTRVHLLFAGRRAVQLAPRAQAGRSFGLGVLHQQPVAVALYSGRSRHAYQWTWSFGTAQNSLSILKQHGMRRNFASKAPHSDTPLPSIFFVARKSMYWKHILLTVAFCSSFYTGSTYLTNESTDYWLSVIDPEGLVASSKTYTLIRKARIEQDLLKFLPVKNGVKDFIALENVPLFPKRIIVDIYTWVLGAWVTDLEERRVVYGVVAVNIAVHLLHCVPRLRPFIRTHFVHNPFSGKWYTLLTSMFNHSSSLQLLGTSMLLLSFGPNIGKWLVLNDMVVSDLELPEATASYHFLALYLCSGLVCNLLAHILLIRLLYPSIAQKLSKGIAVKASELSPRNLQISSTGGVLYVLACITDSSIWDQTVTIAGASTFIDPVPGGYAFLMVLPVEMLRYSIDVSSRSFLIAVSLSAVYHQYGGHCWVALRKRAAKLKAYFTG